MINQKKDIFNLEDGKKLELNIKSEEKKYNIYIANNIINNIAEYIKEYTSSKKIFFITDRNVMNLYGDKVSTLLIQAGYQLTTYIVPAGEESKSYKYLQDGHDLLIENEFRRDNLVLALGGGVVGDLAGFIAATYMRGIPFVQVPTTLLAQVDSSVGGKTAINHDAGKNLIGAFYQPKFVLIDPNFLKTLDLRELKTGLAEVVKHAFIADMELLEFLEEHEEDIYNYDIDSLIYIIYKSCLIKSNIVNEDEKEQGKRALLNFGHTVAHALEAVTEYKKYNHGEAVAVGMAAAADLSYKSNKITEKEYQRIINLLKKYKLPIKFQYQENKEIVFEKLFYDKKVKKNKLRWILLNGLAKAYIDENLSHELVKEVLEGIE
ncbi:3-dehydroquinate synthase [Natronospora cellulosivora (SeqCode)]